MTGEDAFNEYMTLRVELLRWLMETDDNVLTAMINTRKTLKYESTELDDENLFTRYISEYQKLENKEWEEK